MAARRAHLPRGAGVGGCIAIAVLLAALVAGRPGRDGPPLDPRSDGPLGTSALVSLLRGLGAEVNLSVGLPEPTDAVALVLQDRLDAGHSAALTRWVSDGGTLVVTDPSSSFAAPVAGLGLDLADRSISRGTCTVGALGDVGSVDGGAAVRFDAAASDQVCFGDEHHRAFVVVTPLGGGQVVSVGGAAFVTNDHLGRRDNAVLAATLLAPSAATAVRFVDAPVPAGGGTKTLSQLVSGGVKRGLLQLGVAFVLYALWRAIRLGRPVAEDQPVDVAGSELVGAIGRLLSRSRAPGAAAEILRAGLRRSLRARLGVPADASPATLAAITAARTGAEVELVLMAVDDRSITTDAELVAVARAVASVHQEVPQ
ncbi:MAG: DUF4350 domain-containing protein [Acidimicrobiales bacterium]